MGTEEIEEMEEMEQEFLVGQVELHQVEQVLLMEVVEQVVVIVQVE